MVKNIVFDIGNVLVTFNADKMISTYFDESLLDQVKSAFFTSWWDLYDQGLYSKQDLIDKGKTKFPDHATCVEQMMNHWIDHLQAIKDNVSLIEELRSLGYGVYLCSNIPLEAYGYLKETYSFMDLVDGGIYSYQHRLIKPDPKIFELLLDTYHLIADECLFIDDRKENTEAAKQLGFLVIHLEDPSELSHSIKEKLHEV